MVTTSTMHALPITTPMMVRAARALLARSASIAISKDSLLIIVQIGRGSSAFRRRNAAQPQDEIEGSKLGYQPLSIRVEAMNDPSHFIPDVLCTCWSVRKAQVSTRK